MLAYQPVNLNDKKKQYFQIKLKYPFIRYLDKGVDVHLQLSLRNLFKINVYLTFWKLTKNGIFTCYETETVDFKN